MTDAAQSDLLPCPFDDGGGNHGGMKIHTLPEWGRPATRAWMHCKCGARGPKGSNSAEATSHWNTRRATPSPTWRSMESESDVERVARALCKARGVNPDCLHWHEPGEKNRQDGTPWPDDATFSDGKPGHCGWRIQAFYARAAIRALKQGVAEDGRQPEPKASTPTSPNTWRDGIEAAAKVADAEVEQWHNIDGNPARRIAAAIRALSPPSSEQDGGT